MTVRLVLAEWKFVDAGNLEIMRHVETGERFISVQHGRVVKQESDAAVVTGHVDGFRVSVGAFDQEATCQAAIDRDLESVVMRA